MERIRSGGICDLPVVIGTAEAVLPVAEIPSAAKVYRATMAKINLEEISIAYQISDYIILGPCSTIITETVRRIKAQKE